MAVSAKKTKAQQARDEYIKLRTQRSRAQSRTVTAELKPLDLSAIIADPTDNTLIGPKILNGIPALYAWWDNLPDVDDDQETVTLHLAKGHDPVDANLLYEEVDAHTYIVPDYPVSPDAFEVPADKVAADGRYTVKYSLLDYKGDTYWSAPLPIICDRTAPKGPVEPEPDAMTFTSTVITDANVDSVLGTIPRYLLWSAGDTVIHVWERELPSSPEDVPYVGPVPVASGAQTVAFDADRIKEIGDGRCYVSYALSDKAFNRSPFAAWAIVNVALGPLPANLHLPVVELAADGLLDMEDAFAGIWVEFNLYTNWKSRDQIEITWGATVLEVFSVGPSPNPVLKMRVPSATLKSEYGNATGDKTTNVSYRVLRGGAPFGGVQAINVIVNFSLPGLPRPEPDPNLPDWPDPVNRDLDVGTVTSDSGETNKLVPDDEGKDATYTFILPEHIKDGMWFKFWWAGIYMEEEDVIIAGESAGEEKTITVLWKYIEQANNDDELKLYYKMGSPDSPNSQQSPDRLVNANAVVLRPVKPTFNLVNGAGWLTCPSLEGTDHAIVVNVPDLSEWLSPGDEVDVDWWALPGRTGEPEPIDGTKFHDEITLTDEDGEYPVTGFQFRVTPPETYVLPTYVDENNKDGRGRATYGFVYNGAPVTSEVLQANVGMHESTQPGTCPLPPKKQ